MPPDQSRPPRLSLILLALVPFSLGYFLSYLYRAMNAVVAPDLVRDVGLSASGLGMLTAAYLAAFALFQVPLGILLDRYGPRRVQAALVAVGGGGALLFGLADSLATLTLARAVIGLGFAGGLMSGFKAVVIWVPEPRRALANSLIMSVGALGLLVASTPTEIAVQAFGWRLMFWGLAAFTVLVAAIILLVVPERPAPPRPATTLGQELGAMLEIFRDRLFLALAPLSALTAGSQIALQTLWVGPWHRDMLGLDRLEVANRLFLFAGAFLIGILVTGAVADRLARRGVSLLNVMLGFIVLYLVAQAGIIWQPPGFELSLWVLFSMTGQVSVLAFPWIAGYFGAALSGRAGAAINLTMFGSAFAIQYAIGAVIDLYPPPAGGGYAREGYTFAFGIVLALQLVALAWYLAHWRLFAAAERRLATGR